MEKCSISEEIKSDLKEIRKEQTKILIEIATLKVKSSIWGFVAGAIPFVIYYVKKGF